MPLMYIIEDNGVYGLTKGQFYATADIGSTAKGGSPNELPPFDCCALALKWGATFVARSFSGDKKQLQAIIKAAIGHRGLSVIDVVSPCVTFNDHEGSTKSYSYMKEHETVLHELDYVPERLTTMRRSETAATSNLARANPPAARQNCSCRVTSQIFDAL